VVPKPARLSFEQAAAVPMAALTALQGLRDFGGVRAGHRVLINGAAGGVGTYGVQIATALGAEVTGVCSSGKLELVRSLGATHVVDYAAEDFTDGRVRYDVLLDNVGNRPLGRLRRALTPTGTLLLNGGGSPGHVIGALGPVVRAAVTDRFVRSGCGPSSASPTGPTCSRSPDSSTTAGSPLLSTAPTRWPRPPTACGTWSGDTLAARSSSPSPEPRSGQVGRSRPKRGPTDRAV
jgi:hypothetical protein